MIQHFHTKTVKDFIYDASFVQWCLCPTNDLNERWLKYMDSYQEERETIEQARQIVCQAKLNSYKLSFAEKQSLNQHIIRNVTESKQTKIKRIIWQYAAACILLLCVSIAFWNLPKGRTDVRAALFEQTIQPDTTQTEVVLQTSQKKVQIMNKATIRVDAKGKVQISEADIASVNESVKGHTSESANTLFVPKGRHSSLVLADGTKVWVNSGTTLRFPTEFDNNKREIFVEGEIYLEVKKDVSKPFYVRTSKMDVRVLGTSFNVMAYKEDMEQSVVLRSGRVSVNSHSGIERMIKPNERLILDDKYMTINSVNVYDYISWIDGILQFTQQDLGSVLLRLSRYYKVKFTCSSEIKNLTCSGKLVLFDDIDQVLQTLQRSFPIEYEIKGDIINLSMKLKKRGL